MYLALEESQHAISFCTYNAVHLLSLPQGVCRGAIPIRNSWMNTTHTTGSSSRLRRWHFASLGGYGDNRPGLSTANACKGWFVPAR